MRDERGFTGSQITVAFLGGAIAGAAVAILTAPQSGRETREQLGGYVRRRRQQKSAGLREMDAGAIGNGMDEDAIDVSSVR